MFRPIAESRKMHETFREQYALLMSAGYQKDDPTVSYLNEQLNKLERLYLKTSPFKLGESYRLMNGQTIKLVGIANEGTDYESMHDEDGWHRYTTRDFGRVTATMSRNFSCNIDLSLSST